MKDIIDSISAWFKEKTTSPLYGTYTGSFVVWNWQIFYTLFWQEQERLLLPKIEYVQQNLLYGESYLEHLAYIVLPPILITLFIIRAMPYINNWAHKISVDFYFKRKDIFESAKIVYERKKEGDLQELAKIKQQQASSKKIIKANITDEEQWDKEFDDFLNSGGSSEFKGLVNVIYRSAGDISNFDSSRVVAFSHASGLIEYIGGNMSKVGLTEKGKYFVKKQFIEDNKLPF